MVFSSALAKELCRQLIDPRGRCNRQGFLALAIVLLAVQVASGIVFAALGLPLNGTAMLVLNVPLFWIGGVAVLKRLHDIGRTGWWIPAAATFWFVGCLMLSTGAALIVGPERMAAAIEHKTLLFWLIFAAVTLPAFGGLTWVHTAAGETTANRYGDVPGRLGFSLPGRTVELPEGALAA